MIICKNCGGKFAEDATKCPYCGTMHFAGAAIAYNKKIEDLTDDLEDLADLPAQEYTQTVAAHGKHTAKILAITTGICLLVTMLSFALFTLQNNSKEEDNAKAQILWAQETYPTLDTLYEAGDFAAILAFENSLYADDDNIYDLFSWSHHAFLDVYRSYTEVLDIEDMLLNGSYVGSFEAGLLLSFALDAYEDNSYYDYSETDLVYLAQYYQKANDILEEHFALTQADLTTIYQVLSAEDDWVSLSETMGYMEDFI